MLPARHRMRSSDDFASAVRQGGRAGRRTIVGHLSSPPAADGSVPGATTPTLVGFVVSRAVGGAVVRNRVRRRLRHLMRERVQQLPGGERLVVRALPAAAQATSAELARDLDGVLHKLRGKVAAREGAAGLSRSDR